MANNNITETLRFKFNTIARDQSDVLFVDWRDLDLGTRNDSNIQKLDTELYKLLKHGLFVANTTMPAANNYRVENSAITEMFDKMVLLLIPNKDNTDIATLQINNFLSVPIKEVTNNTYSDIAVGELKAKQPTLVYYDLTSNVFVLASALVQSASTTQAGIVQLSNDTDSTDETKAITPKALKSVADNRININQKGIANGVASLDSDGKLSNTQIPSSILGSLKYISTWDASGGTTPANPKEGNYWIISNAGIINDVTYNIKDWLIYNNSVWSKLYGQDNGGNKINDSTQTTLTGILKGDGETINLATKDDIKALGINETIFEVSTLDELVNVLEDGTVGIKNIYCTATITINSNISINACKHNRFLTPVNLKVFGNYTITITSPVDSNEILTFYEDLLIASDIYTTNRTLNINYQNLSHGVINVKNLSVTSVALTVGSSGSGSEALSYEAINLYGTNASTTGTKQSNLFTTTANASASASGLMSSEDKVKIDNHVENVFLHKQSISCIQTGNYANAEGVTTTASGESSHAEGESAIASGNNSHAEGENTKANGQTSHAEGSYSVANGIASHAEGIDTIASGDGSHAEGEKNVASTNNSHVEGEYNLGCHGRTYEIISRDDSTKTITLNKVNGLYVNDLLNIKRSNAYAIENIKITAINGLIVTLETTDSISSSWRYAIKPSTTQYPVHSEGINTIASGESSHAEGNYTIASGTNSHAEGDGAIASGSDSHAEGTFTKASGESSHAEGNYTIASGMKSHAGGNGSTASGHFSYAMGDGAMASGECSHAEGLFAKAIGDNSHAEANQTKANGIASHAEGAFTEANGYASHAEGFETVASGQDSHAQNTWTIAQGKSQTVIGEYNIAQGAATSKVDTDNAFVIGNGSSDTARSNALTCTWEGVLDVAKGITIGGNPLKPVKTSRFVIGTSTAGWTSNDCDYLCYGVDDQVEINNAIQALPANGGKIVILDGTYNISSKIAINKPNINIEGNGDSTILNRTGSSTAPLIDVSSSCDSFQLKNVYIYGNANDGDNIGDKAEIFVRAYKCEITHCSFYKCHTGIIFYQVESILVSNCTFINGRNDLNLIECDNTHIINNNFSASKTGIYLSVCNKIVIAFNIFNNYSSQHEIDDDGNTRNEIINNISAKIN
ncbi:tail fiber protein [Anaerovorax odorimutans]|uniref:tail fiber protein n=1 Tax=Anaerovorax odorimutans TaxID=109327 RepID=UPI0003FFFD59|nr:tail fiber protein [Anaerovorax odorimutans]